MIDLDKHPYKNFILHFEHLDDRSQTVLLDKILSLAMRSKKITLCKHRDKQTEIQHLLHAIGLTLEQANAEYKAICKMKMEVQKTLKAQANEQHNKE